MLKNQKIIDQNNLYIQSQNEKNLNLVAIKVQDLIIQLIVESEKQIL